MNLENGLIGRTQLLKKSPGFGSRDSLQEKIRTMWQ